MKGFLRRIAPHISASDQPPSRADAGADASRSAVFLASINSVFASSSVLVVPKDAKNMRSTSALLFGIPGGLDCWLRIFLNSAYRRICGALHMRGDMQKSPKTDCQATPLTARQTCGLAGTCEHTEHHDLCTAHHSNVRRPGADDLCESSSGVTLVRNTMATLQRP
jgi:hypothetical protein